MEKAHVRRQVGAEKANVSEPLLKCRNVLDDIETGVWILPRDGSGGCLLTGQVVSGMKVARARFQAPVWNVGTPRLDGSGRVLSGWRKGEPQAAETARGRVPMRGRGADRLVVAVKVL